MKITTSKWEIDIKTTNGMYDYRTHVLDMLLTETLDNIVEECENLPKPTETQKAFCDDDRDNAQKALILLETITNRVKEGLEKHLGP